MRSLLSDKGKNEQKDSRAKQSKGMGKAKPHSEWELASVGAENGGGDEYYVVRAA